MILNSQLLEEVIKPLLLAFGKYPKTYEERDDGIIVIKRDSGNRPHDRINVFLHIWDVCSTSDGGTFKVCIIKADYSWVEPRLKRACPADWTYYQDDSPIPVPVVPPEQVAAEEARRRQADEAMKRRIAQLRNR